LPTKDWTILLSPRSENHVGFPALLRSSLTLNIQKKCYILAEDIKNALYDCLSIDKFSNWTFGSCSWIEM